MGEPDWEAIKRSILEKLRRRLKSLGVDWPELRVESRSEKSETDRFNRILALWIDFQRAWLAQSQRHIHCAGACLPWNWPDVSVRKAWLDLTEPRYALALESLYYQLGDGPQLDLARMALQYCRERRKHLGRPGDAFAARHQKPPSATGPGQCT